MSDITVTNAYDMGEDVLLVQGTHPDLTRDEHSAAEAVERVESRVGEDGVREDTITRTQVFTVRHIPVVLEARGHVSALTNHYDPSAYGEDGNRDPKAEARAMNGDEARAYMIGLLREQNALAVPPEEAAPPRSLDLAKLGL